MMRDGQATVFLTDIRPLYREEAQQRAWLLADAGRRKKADACKTLRGRAESLAAGLLADYALRQLGLGDCCVRYDERGKPYVQRRESGTLRVRDGAPDNPGHSCFRGGAPDSLEHSCFRGGAPDSPEHSRFQGGVPDSLENSRFRDGAPAYLSLSHSGDYAVCAVADRPVGADIQQLRPVRAGVLRHFLEESERLEFLKRYGTEGELTGEAAQEFFRLWTAKESYLKMTGSGLAAGFANLVADAEKGTVQEKNREGSAALWKQYRAPKGYFLSVCLEGDGGKDVRTAQPR